MVEMFTDDLETLLIKNENAKIARIESFPLRVFNEDKYIKNKCEFFFCGAVVDSRGHIIGIPNGYNYILDIDPIGMNISQWGYVNSTVKKGWTGGALLENGYVIGFSRGSNSILQIDTIRREILYKNLLKKYNEEHHYGGVLTDKGIVYQPPKNYNKILKYDSVSGYSEELSITQGWSNNKKMLFYGGMTDLNDNVYFFPAGRFSKVCMINKKGQVRMIGKLLHNVFFNSGTLAANGDIYGFSSYSSGILHIRTADKHTEILNKNISGGYFGAKLAFNGKIYSIPGNSDCVIEFDPTTNQITREIPLPDCEIGAKAKCAGGAIDREGNIWCVPAMGHYIYKICFEGIKIKPSEKLYRSKFFKSFY